MLKIYEKTLGESSLKRKNKRNFSICFFLSWSSLSLIRGSYFNKNLRKGKFQFLWLRHKMGCWQFLTNFVNFDNICHVILRKKTFSGGLIVSVNRRRKEIKVTFASFSIYAGRFTHYFHIRFVKFYFGFKDHRVFEVLCRLPATHLLY